MQAYTWTSNQYPQQNYQERLPQYRERLPQYQERPSSQYQERPPPQYQERPSSQYQERAPPRYQERPAFHYQDQFPLKYQDVRNEQPNMFQGQYNTQPYNTPQARYSNGQQDADFRPNFNGYNAQTNRAHPQSPYAASNTQQQHYPSENQNPNGYYAQFDMQSNVSSPQNYRNTGHNQAHMYLSPQSDHGSSVGNNRGWKFQMYNNGNSCSGNNQQLQPVRTTPHHHQQQQQQPFSRRHSGKQHKQHNRTKDRHPKSTSRAHKKEVSQKISTNEALNQTATSNASCNSTTPPSDAESGTSLPSNNLNQSPVNQTQPELRSNAGTDVSTTQSQNNQSTEQPSQSTNRGTYNANETAQITQIKEAHSPLHHRFVTSLIYKLLCTKNNEPAVTQQSDERIAHHNTGSEQSEVCASNRTDHHSKEPFSEPSAQCTVEPPSKRFKCAVVQRDYWSKDRSDFGVQSVKPVTHQTSGNESRPKGISQHIIQYSTDPADCLEAVFALQKVSQQVHKAIAIVPPISQQTSNTAQMADTSPRKAESPPLKIDSVWSLKESDAQKVTDDKLPESPSPTAEQQEKSLEIERTNNIPDSDIFSTIPKSTDICSTIPKSTVICSIITSTDICSTIPTSTDICSILTSTDICSTIPRSTDICSTIPTSTGSTNPALLVECQNYVQQGDCDSNTASFDLSSVPVVKHTLGNLMDSVKSLELMELSSGYPEKSESPMSTILQLFWNGNQVPLVEKHIALRKELMERCSSSEIIRDYESVVLESIETENLKKLAHCEVLNNEMYSSSEEFRSSWLNVDGQPADIEKVLSEQLLNDITVIEAPSQLLSNNAVVTPANLDLPEVSSTEKDLDPDTCSPTALFTPQSGNDTEEMDAESNGHSYAGLSRIKFLSSVPSEKGMHLSSVSSEKETFKNQEDIKQNHNFDTQPSVNSPLAERSTEKLTDCSNKIEVSKQDHSEQARHSVSVSDLLPRSPRDNVSDGVKNSFSTETLCISEDENPANKEALNNSSDIGLVEDIFDDENTGNKEVINTSDIWLVEDISDDENTGNEVLPTSSDIWLVEDISDNENTEKKEVLPTSSDICLVEDISDNENKEVLPNCSDIWQVQEISDDETPSKEDTCSNSSDICVVEDISNDENSSDDCLSMEITVLSSEDAKTFFQELEDKPECDMKTSNFDCPDIEACFDVPSQPHYDICSLCGSKIKISNSTNVTNSDADLFCPQCWAQAPLLELEKEPCSPLTNEAGVLGSPTKSNKQARCRPPCVKLEVKEPDVAAKKEYTVDDRLTGHRSHHMVKSEPGQNLSSLELKVKELNVASQEMCIVDERLMGQICDSMVKSELGQTLSPLSLDLKVKELTVTSTKKCIDDEGLSGQKREIMVKSELGQNCGRPFLELKVNESTVASTKKCIDEGLTGQKREIMVKSELGQNCGPPFPELKVNESTVASTKNCIDEGLTGQKREIMVKSELGQNCGRPSLELKVNEPTVASTKKCIDEGLKGQKGTSLFKSETSQYSSPPSLKVQVKVPNVAPPDECTENERLTGQKRDGMVKSALGQNCGRQSLELKVDEPTVASTKKCIDDEGLKGQKSKGLFKSEPRQYCIPPSLELKVDEPTVASTKKCVDDQGQKSKSLFKSELRQYCSPPSLELKVDEPTVASTKKCVDDQGQKSKSLFKSETSQYCSPPSLKVQAKVPNVAPPDECTENERLTGQKRDGMVKSALGQNCGRQSLELKVDEPTVASTKKCIDDEGLKGQKSKGLFKSEPRQYCIPPSLELKVDEPTVTSTKKCIDDEGLKGQKRKSLFTSELRQKCSSASLQSQVKVPNVTPPEKCIADEGLTGQKSDSMVKSVTQKVPEIQMPAEHKIQPNEQKKYLKKKNKLAKPQTLVQCNKPPSKKSASLKHKLKSGSASTDSADSVLFTPDIVVKKAAPKKTKNASKKRQSGESQDCRKAKKFKEHRQASQEHPDRTSPHHRENSQKVTEKVPSHSNDTSPSKNELHGILSVNKTKTPWPKKVRFDLYGSSRETQMYAPERRFSAPATLMVSDACNDYSDVLSAKQKVLHQWSSTFIPKTKKSPQEAAPKKIKPQKPQDALKSNMSALKSHLVQRTKFLSGSERRTNHFRKPGFHQKLTKTLSG